MAWLQAKVHFPFRTVPQCPVAKNLPKAAPLQSLHKMWNLHNIAPNIEDNSNKKLLNRRNRIATIVLQN